MNDYSQLEHIKLIQVVVGRMAQNSFVLKGWSVTLATGLLAAAIVDKPVYAALALFPALSFWGLDAYYLRQERLFRALHDAVAAHSDTPTMRYSFDTRPHRAQVGSWLWACRSITVAGLHGTVVLVILIVLKAASVL